VPEGFYDKLGTGTGMHDTTKAVLLVGRKADKTRLALGGLSEVRNSSGPMPQGLYIDSTSTTATFTVTAIDLKLTLSANKANSSFQTGQRSNDIPSVVNTKIVDVENKITGDKFPMYCIPAEATYLVYYIPAYLYFDYEFFSMFGSSLINPRAVPPIRVKWPPRYTSAADGRTYELPPPYASNLIIRSISYQTINNPFIWNYSIYLYPQGFPPSGGVKEGVAAFTFEVPFNGISRFPSNAGIEPIEWFFRPSLRSAMYDLDNESGMGGSILICVGDYAPESGSLEIITSGP
jgi:hypothetical protein